jgi:quercetin dioxygenase-like cupin family protein
MFLPMLLMTAAVAQADVPSVPGLCTAPVPTDRETPGCYQTSELDLAGAPTKLYWHIREYPTMAAAHAEAANHRWAAVAAAHSRYWLYVLSEAAEPATGGIERAVIGPLALPAGPAVAHFSEAIFPPGMKTRIHSHPGPEAFYIVAGEQCMETPSDKRKIRAGGTYVVPGGVHLQAAPHGRRNLMVIIAPKGVPFVIPGSETWAPTGFCA